MPRAHRRFELLDVVLDDLPIGRCTIDHWEDDRGDVQWSARVLMARAHGTTSGRLMGRTREGEWVAGPATFGAHQDGPRGAATVLVELHGTGPLVPVEPPEPPDPPEPPTPSA